MARKFRRLKEKDGAWIGGVCAGAAYWIGMPVWLVRLVWFLFASGTGIGLWVYILLWILLPKWEEKPSDFAAVTGD